MTREEAIARIKDHKNIHKMNEPRAIYITEAFDMAIKELEQEPCADCISRQAAIKAIYDNKDRLNIAQAIRELPSINPQPKTGYWIKIKPYPLQMHDYECSECLHETDDPTENYCSECGAKMCEPQESEDKE